MTVQPKNLSFVWHVARFGFTKSVYYPISILDIHVNTNICKENRTGNTWRVNKFKLPWQPYSTQLLPTLTVPDVITGAWFLF